MSAVRNTPLPVICRLSKESAADLARIDRECNSPPWSEALFEAEFSNPHSFSYGLRLSGQLIGFLLCHAILDEAHIMSFGVLRAFRRMGAGRTLLVHVLKELHQQAVRWVTLEVRRSNEAAKRLYLGLGFVEVSERHAYYTDNQEDALVLKLNLSQFIHETRREI